MSIKLRARQVYFRDQHGNYVPLPAFSAPSEGGGGTGGGGDGYTYTPYVSPEGVISWTNNGGLPNPASVNIKGPAGDTGPQGEQGVQGIPGEQGAKGDRGDAGPQGEQGPEGKKGDTGATGTTFTPSVSSAGVISWSNDGGKANPSSVNIKGPQGDQGIQGPAGPAGETGPAGHTPVKGTDYWTTADRQSMVSDVLAALPTWTGGSY